MLEEIALSADSTAFDGHAHLNAALEATVSTGISRRDVDLTRAVVHAFIPARCSLFDASSEETLSFARRSAVGRRNLLYILRR